MTRKKNICASLRTPIAALLVTPLVAGCATSRTPENGRRLDRNHVLVDQEPEPQPRTSSLGQSDWPSLALDVEGRGEPLQNVFETVSSSLARLGTGQYSSGERVAFALRQKVAQELAPVLGILAQTWAKVRSERPELGQLEGAFFERMDEIRDPVLGINSDVSARRSGHVALAGLLVELAAVRVEGSEKNKDEVPSESAINGWRDWTLEVLRWATSREAVYASAFGGLGGTWKSPSSSSPKGPWATQSVALASLSEFLTGPPLSVESDANVDGVRVSVDGTSGYLTLRKSSVNDHGGYWSTGNGILDESELVTLVMNFQRAGGSGPVLSESIVPANIPSCVVVPESEVVLGEAQSGGDAVGQIRVLVSGRCEKDVRVGLTVVSSQGPSTNLTLTASPLPNADVSTSFILDTDMPGHSVSPDAGGGLVADQKLEITPAVSGTVGYEEVELRNLAFADLADKVYLNLGPLRSTSFQARQGGLTLEDDIEVTVGSSRTLEQRDEGRAQTKSIISTDRAGIWFALELSMTRAGRTAQLTQSASAKKVREWLAARAPEGVAVSGLTEPLTSIVNAVMAKVESIYGKEEWFAPSPGDVAEALESLLSQDLLTEAEVTAVLQRFEIDAEIAASIAQVLVTAGAGSSVVHPTVGALLDHVDARAAASAVRMSNGMSDDEARGIGIRVATSSATPAKTLEQALVKVLEGANIRGLDTPARRLARSILLVSAVVDAVRSESASWDRLTALVLRGNQQNDKKKSLPDPALRAIVGQLGVLSLDVRRAPGAAREAVVGQLASRAIGLDRPAETSIVNALIDLIQERNLQAAQSAAKANSSNDYRQKLGATNVRGQHRVSRWVRLPLAGK
jgi:hypothetical protein